MKLLKLALDRENYELAAHILVYGLIKASVGMNEENKKDIGNKHQREKKKRCSARK